MSHMVIFQTPDGSPGYNQFESVEEAVGFVEKLRNDQGIENARMFALEEIKFDLKPYFKVELQALNPGTTPSAPAASPSPSASPSPAPAAAPAAAPAPSAPAPAAAPSAAAPAPSSGETTSFGSPSPAAAPAPAPAAEPAPAPAEAPSGDAQPTRRGLFGR